MQWDCEFSACEERVWDGVGKFEENMVVEKMEE